MCLELQNSTQSHWKNKAQTSQGSPRVPLFLSSFFSSSPLLSFASSSQPSLSRLLYSPVHCMCEEHCRRAMVEWVVTGWSSSSLYCSLDQYWDMSGSLPGTWTGTDTPGEMSPAGTEREICQLRIKKNYIYIKIPRSQHAKLVDAPCTVSVRANTSFSLTAQSVVR